MDMEGEELLSKFFYEVEINWQMIDNGSILNVKLV